MIWASDNKANDELFLTSFHLGRAGTVGELVAIFDGGDQIAIVNTACTFTDGEVDDDNGIIHYHRDLAKTTRLDTINNLTCWFIGTDCNTYCADFDLVPYKDVIMVTLTTLELQNPDDDEDDYNYDDDDWC